MLFLKRLISRLFFPVPLGLGVILLGLGLLVWTRRQRTGKGLVALGAVWLLACAYGDWTEEWLRSIEGRHRPVSAAEASVRPVVSNEVEWILVPGRGVSTASLPAHSRMDGEFLQRFVEAVRIHRLRPGSRIAVAVPGTVLSDAERRTLVDDLMTTLAVPPDRVTVVSGARDTQEEMVRFAGLAGTNRTWLVTNAAHMPRALILARRAGLDPVPSPGGYQVGESRPGEPFNPASLFPDARGLDLAERAVYERLGLLFEQMRSRPRPQIRPIEGAASAEEERARQAGTDAGADAVRAAP
jgi:uncharacterized SAM-binding protein YcdF (DUF218 family)